MARKSVTVESEIAESAPPADWDPAEGTIDVYRVDPPGGWLTTLQATEAKPGTIAEAWGGGTFELAWNPPAGSEAKPRRRRLVIAGTPRDLDGRAEGKGGAGGLAGALLSRLTAIEGRMQERQSSEWQALLDLTRRQAEDGSAGFSKSLEANAERFVATLKAQAEAERARIDAAAASERERAERAAERERERAAERERERAAERERERERTRQDREAERARLDAERERDRQFYGAMMAMQAAAGPAGAGGDEIERMERLSKLAQALGGGWVGQLINAAPQLIDGAANGFANVATAAAEYRRQRAGKAESSTGRPADQLPAPDTATGFEGGTGGNGKAGAATVAESSPATEERELTPEEAALLGWLDWLRTVPVPKWRAVIGSQLTSGVIPSLLDGPLRAAVAGDASALQRLLIQAESEDIWQAAVEAGAFGGKRAVGKSGAVGSAGRAGSPVVVAPGNVAPADG